MSTLAADTPLLATPEESPQFFRIGKTFLHPALDYMLIGGGLSLVAAVGAWLASGMKSADIISLPWVFLVFNWAHFAASTVRLYAKPGAYQSLPFLTMGFPLVTILVLSLGIVFSDLLGRHFVSLYLTWNPYHYCAQAYGLAVMYSYRSGCNLSINHKRALWWSCMIPFIKSATCQPATRVGIWWLLPIEWATTQPRVAQLLIVLSWVIDFAAILIPLAVFIALQTRSKLKLPLIAPLLMLTNASWFVLFPFVQAIMLAAIFHGLQYLAIVTIFHVKDQIARPKNRHGSFYHATIFYGLCLMLGYALFRLWPAGYIWMGANDVASVLLVVSIINVHHFIVDGFIWKLKKDPNYRIVEDTSPA